MRIDPICGSCIHEGRTDCLDIDCPIFNSKKAKDTKENSFSEKYNKLTKEIDKTIQEKEVKLSCANGKYSICHYKKSNKFNCTFDDICQFQRPLRICKKIT